MAKYAAFLRGINLGPHRRISSTELRELFEGMGFGQVAPFRSSGNVAFAAGRERPAKLTGRIEASLAERVGLEVAVFLRSAEELIAIAAQQPFDRKTMAATQGRLQVVLLATEPASADRKQVLALATDQDRLAFGARELYWLPRGGTRDSGLDFKSIEGLLGPTTMRTKGTVDALVAKHFGR